MRHTHDNIRYTQSRRILKQRVQTDNDRLGAFNTKALDIRVAFGELGFKAVGAHEVGNQLTLSSRRRDDGSRRLEPILKPAHVLRLAVDRLDAHAARVDLREPRVQVVQRQAAGRASKARGGRVGDVDSNRLHQLVRAQPVRLKR